MERPESDGAPDYDAFGAFDPPDGEDSSMQRPENADGPYAVLSQAQIADLWERGYTMIPRTLFGHDPYAIADAIKRPGMAQQWGDAPKLTEYRASGWKVVSREDWHGLFAPYGSLGQVEINGLVLMQQPQHKVDAANTANHAAARKNVQDWKDQAEANGFVFPIDLFNCLDPSQKYVVRDDETKTIDTTVGIPREMTPYIAAILAERDRICDDYANGRPMEGGTFLAISDAVEKNSPDKLKWPALRAIVLPIAIENVRAQLKQGGSDAEEENTADADRPDGRAADARSTVGDGSAVDAERPETAGGDGAAPGASPGERASDGEPRSGA